MKNMFRKVKNNMEYAKWRKIREEALIEANKHSMDEDETEFRYWNARFLLASSKCHEIDID